MSEWAVQLDRVSFTYEGTQREILHEVSLNVKPVSYTHLTLPTMPTGCRSRWSPYH